MHATSVYIAREQFIRHQSVVYTQARSEDFCTRVVRALLHTCVFVTFKSNCTVCETIIWLVSHGQTAYFRFSMWWWKKGLIWFTDASGLGSVKYVNCIISTSVNLKNIKYGLLYKTFLNYLVFLMMCS